MKHVVSATLFTGLCLLPNTALAHIEQHNVKTEEVAQNDKILAKIVWLFEQLAALMEAEATANGELAEPPLKLQRSCGDGIAPDAVFPIVRHRVLIAYSPQTLDIARKKYCQDAWVLPSGGESKIVLASFSDEHVAKALYFAAKVNELGIYAEVRRAEIYR